MISRERMNELIAEFGKEGPVHALEGAALLYIVLGIAAGFDKDDLREGIETSFDALAPTIKTMMRIDS